MTNPNLQPQQYFHGTRGDFSMVLPPNKTGLPQGSMTHADQNEDGIDRRDMAFVMTHEPSTHPGYSYETPDKAEDYAWNMALEQDAGSERRPKVYTVKPAADMEPGPYNRGDGTFPEYVSKTGFEVTGQSDIRPGHQGTFPQVNWNDYRSPASFSRHDLNHPHNMDFDPDYNSAYREHERRGFGMDKIQHEGRYQQFHNEGLFPLDDVKPTA